MFEKYVDMARKHENFSDLEVVGMDETSRTKGHDYVILFVDLKKRLTTGKLKFNLVNQYLG